MIRQESDTALKLRCTAFSPGKLAVVFWLVEASWQGDALRIPTEKPIGNKSCVCAVRRVKFPKDVADVHLDRTFLHV